MNIILQIESEIYDLMEDITAHGDQGSAYENMYWAARGMCRVACQFTNDADETDMFDRIQQSVLQRLANDQANKDDDDREEAAAEMAHVDDLGYYGPDDRLQEARDKAQEATAATLADMFSTLRKGEAAVVPEVAFEPANIPDVTAAPTNDEVFF